MIRDVLSIVGISIALWTMDLPLFSQQTQKNFYDFTVKTLEGEDFPLSHLKGKKVIVVNTASRCGLTPQYAVLEELYKTYKDSGLVIIGFPSNDFKEQEPGDNEQIREFCQANYGVTFPMMEKISVVGKDIHPLYVWLTKKSRNGIVEAPVQWNFQKFLLNRDGTIYRVISPKESPNSPQVIEWIEQK